MHHHIPLPEVCENGQAHLTFAGMARITELLCHRTTVCQLWAAPTRSWP